MSEENNKKRTISAQADEIRKELDDLIGDNIMLDVESDPKDLPIKSKPADTLPAISYSQLKSSATTKAQKTIAWQYP